jgi:hypothetical protein
MTAPVRHAHKEINDVAAIMVGCGLEFVRWNGRGHTEWRYPPTGELMTLPQSPGGGGYWRENSLKWAAKITGQTVPTNKRKGGKPRHVRVTGFSMDAARRDRLRHENHAPTSPRPAPVARAVASLHSGELDQIALEVRRLKTEYQSATTIADRARIADACNQMAMRKRAIMGDVYAAS